MQSKTIRSVAYPIDGGIVSLLLSPIRMPEDLAYIIICKSCFAEDIKCTDKWNQDLVLQKITINTNIPSLNNMSYTCKTKRKKMLTQNKPELQTFVISNFSVPRRNLKGALPTFESKILPLLLSLPM